jgi:hypothetical protein
MKKPKNYINNKTLYTAMIEHKTKLEESERLHKPKPQIATYIGQAIILINENLAKRPNFSGYSYIDEMKSDGELDCIAAVDNFNPNKTNNPFGYFTQIAWNAFIRRITKEHKHTYIKHKNFENSFLMNMLWSDAENIHLNSNEYSSEIIKSFEDKLTKAKKPSKVTGVELFQGDETDE